MEDLASLSWPTLLIAGAIGAGLMSVSFKFFNSPEASKKENHESQEAWQLSTLAMSGFFLLIGAVVIALLKLTK